MCFQTLIYALIFNYNDLILAWAIALINSFAFRANYYNHQQIAFYRFHYTCTQIKVE